MRDAAIFMTHRWDTALAAHFDRLKREAAPYADVLLVVHAGDGLGVSAIPADVLLTNADCEARVPGRYRDSIGRKSLAESGYVDLVWISAMVDPRLSAYERVWLIEYDVDFSGDWGLFFSTMAGDESDVLTANLRRWPGNEKWIWWKSLERPQEADSAPIAGFFPISRFSRRFIDRVHQLYAGTSWRGHLEVVLPTLADVEGFSLAEISGSSAFTPPDREELFYNRKGVWTHRFRPVHAGGYFGTAPEAFPRRNSIYHPVKAEPPKPPVPPPATAPRRARSKQRKPPTLLGRIKKLIRRLLPKK